MPRHLCVMRPARSTAVASTTTRPARPRANCIRCCRCQSVALPSCAEYWHIGDTTIRLGNVSGPTLSGSNRLGTGRFILPEAVEWDSFSALNRLRQCEICARGGAAPGDATRRARAAPPSEAAEPVVALILPVAPRIIVEHGQSDDVLGVFEAELGRDADAQGKPETRRQRLPIKGQRHLGLRMQR